MPMNAETLNRQMLVGYESFLNRESSDLAFIERVLGEADNPNHPLLERLHFLIITEMLLDEFYRIRIAALRARIRSGDRKKSFDGLLPEQELHMVDRSSNALLALQGRCWDRLARELATHGVKLVEPDELSGDELTRLSDYYSSTVEPILDPIVITPNDAFPFLPDGDTFLGVSLKDDDGNEAVGVVSLPDGLPRFHKLMGHDNRFLTLEAIVEASFKLVFPGWQETGFGLARVLREGNLKLADDTDDLPSLVRGALERRAHSSVIRLNVNKKMPEHLRRYFASAFQLVETESLKGFETEKKGISTSEFVAVDGLLGIADTAEIIPALDAKIRESLIFPKIDPERPQISLMGAGDIFEAIREKDRLLHFPYDDFREVIQFLTHAAEDPEVTEIKQTLYRVGADSPVVDILARAAKAGKSVTAVVELEAREDEEANLEIGQKLESAGVHVYYGFLDMKVHAKAIMIARTEDDGRKLYVNFSTGNYHFGAGNHYTDLSLFTCDPVFGRDAERLFTYLTTEKLPSPYERLEIAPLTLRASLLKLISKEIRCAREGRPAAIWLKLNKLTDPELMAALQSAADAGVVIKIVVRGICCLKPNGGPNQRNISIKSVVGRYLEHARIFCFGNGNELPSEKATIFISSADWMPHKIDGRVEAMVPIESPELKDRILNEIMHINLNDEAQSWILNNEGIWSRQSKEGLSAHEAFAARAIPGGPSKYEFSDY